MHGIAVQMVVSRCVVLAALSVATTGCNRSSPSLTAAQNITVSVSPTVIASGSSEQFMITCQAEMGQRLYHPTYQFFFNGSPIGALTNSSYIMVNATSSGYFTCEATQYSDLGTPIPSLQSPPVQAIVLGEPTALHWTML